MRLEANSILAGKFRLKRPLSRGGMGAIWVAQHLQLDTLVAVKFMSETFADSAVLRARFEREARAAAQLKSPHIVNVYDFGFEKSVPYLVMELLRGEDLHQRLLRCGSISLPETLHILVQAGKALRGVHNAGLVHRDLKPGNLFLARVDGQDDDVVKLLDFGIAKETTTQLVKELSVTGEVMGSPHYMSPEQLNGERDLDARSDLWALGIILFRMITGRLPFHGEAIANVVTQIMLAPIPSAKELVPELPAELDAFFARALARERADRFEDVRDMVNEFARVIGAPPFFSVVSDPAILAGWPTKDSAPEANGSVPGATSVRLGEATEPIARLSAHRHDARGTPQDQVSPVGTLTGAVNLTAPLRARAALARVARPVVIAATLAVVGIGVGIAALMARATVPTEAPVLQASPPAATAGALDANAANAANAHKTTTVEPSPAALGALAPIAAGSSGSDATPTAPAQGSPAPSAATPSATPSDTLRAPPSSAWKSSPGTQRKTAPGSRKKPAGREPDWGL